MRTQAPEAIQEAQRTIQRTIQRQYRGAIKCKGAGGTEPSRRILIQKAHVLTSQNSPSSLLRACACNLETCEIRQDDAK